jgi:diguanylate cyclase (GGDEF)-like protein
MPRQPRIKDVTPAIPIITEDPVTTMLVMLLPVHSAATADWLVDATATAAERTLNAAFTFVYLEEQDGRLAYKAPASDLRRRALQRAIDAFSIPVLTTKIDPAAAPAIAEALDAEHPITASAAELLRGIAGEKQASAAQEALGVDSMSIVPLRAANERLGALLMMFVGEPQSDHVRLFADHVACAFVNLRQSQTGRETAEEADVVRTVFDARKTEAELQRELLRAERYHRQASICVIEATNLKLLRERFGPALVEEAYERMGQALAAHSRDIDVIGQYRESGYTMILSEASPEGAEQAAKRLLRVAQDAGHVESAPALELHLATGRATYPVDGTMTEELFAVAQERMYGLPEARRAS